MKRILFTLLACAAVSAASAHELLRINPDARSTSMGGTAVGTSGDAYPTFNNPAAPLFEYQSVQASFGYTLFSGAEFGKNRLMAVGGYVKLRERHALSLGVRLALDPRNEAIAPRRPDAKAFDVAYGYKIGEYVALAATARYMHYNNGGERNTNAIGFDVGVMSRLPLALCDGSEVGIGAKVSNAGFWWGDECYELPLSLSAGASLLLPVRDSHSLEFALDAGYCFSPKALRRFSAGIGVEYTLMQLLKFRCGGNFTKHLSYGSIGLGVRFFHLQFDVAYIMAGRHNPMRNAVQFCAGLDF